MSARVQRAEYFYATVRDRPGEAYRVLSQLAASQVSLLAFNAIPMGPESTQLMLFPAETGALARAAEELGVAVTGPQPALLIRGDDKLAELIDIHKRLADARINVYASSGVTADCGRFGYVIYLKPEDFDAAAEVLGV
jgi:hypothetical protein